MSKRGWDLTSTHSLEAAAEWLRDKAGALVVMVVRPGDGALAVDELIDVVDVHDRIWQDAPKMLGELRRIRDEERAKALKREVKGKKGKGDV